MSTQNPAETETESVEGMNQWVPVDETPNQVTLYTKRRSQLIPSNREWTMLEQICKIAAAKHRLPKNCGDWHDAFLVALRGLDLGMSAMESMERLYIVNDKIVMSTEVKIAQVRRSGIGTFKFETTEHSCKVTGTRHTGIANREPETYTVEWTMEKAHKAGLTDKDNWKNYPEKMLAWRAISDVCDILFADLMYGMPSGEFAMEDGDGEIAENIVDGEFVMIGDKLIEDEANQKKEALETAKRLIEESKNAVASPTAPPTAPPSQPAGPPSAPPASTIKPPEDTAPVSPEPCTDEQIQSLRNLKTSSVMSTPEWKAYLLKKFGVMSATQLTMEQANTILNDPDIKSVF